MMDSNIANGWQNGLSFSVMGEGQVHDENLVRDLGFELIGVEEEEPLQPDQYIQDDESVDGVLEKNEQKMLLHPASAYCPSQGTRITTMEDQQHYPEWFEPLLQGGMVAFQTEEAGGTQQIHVDVPSSSAYANNHDFIPVVSEAITATVDAHTPPVAASTSKPVKKRGRKPNPNPPQKKKSQKKPKMHEEPDTNIKAKNARTARKNREKKKQEVADLNLTIASLKAEKSKMEAKLGRMRIFAWQTTAKASLYRARNRILTMQLAESNKQNLELLGAIHCINQTSRNVMVGTGPEIYFIPDPNTTVAQQTAVAPVPVVQQASTSIATVTEGVLLGSDPMITLNDFDLYPSLHIN